MTRDERGQVVVLVAILIVVLLGFAALAVDVGYMYTTRHELQRSADSGALAGASSFVTGTWSSDDTDPVMIESRDRARDLASRDPVVTSRLDASGEIDVSFPSQDRCRVDTHRNVPLFFARIFGRTDTTIRAYAVAEAAVADLRVKCLKPWAIPLPWDDSDGDRQWDTGEAVQDNIAAIPVGTRLILHIGDPFHQPGQSNDNALQQESGHFFNISLCDDSGASDYRERIAAYPECLDDCGISVGDNYDPSLNPEFQVRTQPGVGSGPTRQGFEDLIRTDSGAYWDNTTNTILNSAYADPLSSPRVVKVPLYDPSDALAGGPAVDLPQGRVPIRVAGFAGFFIESVVNSPGGQITLTGRMMNEIDPGSSSSSGPSPGATVKILRLVE